jgi:signal transduction histidine kinase
MPPFHFNAFIFAAGLLYALLALACWSLLRGQPQRQAVVLWSLGSFAMGVALTFNALRDAHPGWVLYTVTQSFTVLSFSLRIVALRLDLGRPPRWLLTGLSAAAVVGGFQLCLQLPDDRPHVVFGYITYCIGSLTLAVLAQALSQVTGSRSARLLAAVEAAYAAGLLLRLLLVATGVVPPRAIGESWDFALLVVLGFVAGLYSNLGYMGMALDRDRAAQALARADRLAEQFRREAAEQRADALRLLLEQRDRLASERDRLLHVLAHEIRQPLHNANGALQSAAHVLRAGAPSPQQAAAGRLMRAQSVLGEVRSVLDNTLTASAMLTRMAPLARDEVDLIVLVELTIGDLNASERARVSVQRRTRVRTAWLDPGLTRLAVRNLLQNAFRHGGPAVQVRVRIEEQAEPPATVLVVEDDGVGMPQGGSGQALDAGQVLDWPADHQGLGLFIVRRVMALHGGRFSLGPTLPHGSTARLSFPEPEGLDGA